ncbi:LysR family transcriptional regulator [Denitromonas sp.]|uniref:LysR family transcriptional regulator n=1 Tax=Denitromonas sp. TaxID=2734609 RepID=UPI002AFEDD67|nr:LysR family transcriptional regulator [Denitromonas sp.]
MRRKIPSTGALIAFEAAARHESFTRAAEELSLTQGAICRQIASLEEFVGVALFKRARRGVKLTDAGLSYSRQVASRLDAVERDTLSIMGHHAGGRSIELAVVPTFATRWLLPRLSDFLAEHPEASVNLSTRTRPFLFAETDFDAAIYFGDADWPGTQAHFLMHENPVPVCSPRLLPPGPHTAASLAEAPLLQQSTRPYAWRQWFETQGVRAARDLHGPRLELFSMLAQAAMHDMGVALIPPFLIQDELTSGRLVVPVDATYDSGKAYYLMIPERKTEAALLGAFRHWLLAQIARFVGTSPDQSSSDANASTTRE